MRDRTMGMQNAEWLKAEGIRAGGRMGNAGMEGAGQLDEGVNFKKNSPNPKSKTAAHVAKLRAVPNPKLPHLRITFENASWYKAETALTRCGTKF
jgi:hypothetical protein